MKFMKLLASMVLSMSVAGVAYSDLVIPSLEYRTGPYAPNGIHFADGFTDYFTLLN
ncbi:MAG: ABC transporter permease, partial [Gammaproteobacteria bacterium]|nr:ABC transporter permease [Gammaproteobacteria bacterium]